MVLIMGDTPEWVPAVSCRMPAVGGQHRCVILTSHLSVCGLSHADFLVLEVRSHSLLSSLNKENSRSTNRHPPPLPKQNRVMETSLTNSDPKKHLSKMFYLSIASVLLC